MKRKKEIYVLGVIFIFVLGYFLGLNSNSEEKDFILEENSEQNFAQQNSSQNKKTEKKLYSVLEVIDGDTIKINYKGQKKSVRILGMNTPEKSGPYRKTECFGEDASKKAKEIFKNSKYVSLEFDSSQSRYDKFGRILAYVYLENGENFEEKMIKEGYAYEYTYHGHKYKYQKKFKEAQKYAEKNKLGLWAKDSCNGLKEFKK